MNSEAPPAVQVETNRLHKFKWNNADFVEVYVDCLEKLLVCKVAEYKLYECSLLERLDFLHCGINSSLLKAARSAEKKCGLVTSNGVRRGKCKYSVNKPEISQISSELRALGESDAICRQILVTELVLMGFLMNS